MIEISDIHDDITLKALKILRQGVRKALFVIEEEYDDNINPDIIDDIVHGLFVLYRERY